VEIKEGPGSQQAAADGKTTLIGDVTGTGIAQHLSFDLHRPGN
jgi:hypothetical protein